MPTAKIEPQFTENRIHRVFIGDQNIFFFSSFPINLKNHATNSQNITLETSLELKVDVQILAEIFESLKIDSSYTSSVFSGIASNLVNFNNQNEALKRKYKFPISQFLFVRLARPEVDIHSFGLTAYLSLYVKNTVYHSVCLEVIDFDFQIKEINKEGSSRKNFPNASSITYTKLNNNRILFLKFGEKVSLLAQLQIEQDEINRVEMAKEIFQLCSFCQSSNQSKNLISISPQKTLLLSEVIESEKVIDSEKDSFRSGNDRFVSVLIKSSNQKINNFRKDSSSEEVELDEEIIPTISQPIHIFKNKNKAVNKNLISDNHSEEETGPQNLMISKTQFSYECHPVKCSCVYFFKSYFAKCFEVTVLTHVRFLDGEISVLKSYSKWTTTNDSPFEVTLSFRKGRFKMNEGITIDITIQNNMTENFSFIFREDSFSFHPIGIETQQNIFKRENSKVKIVHVEPLEKKKLSETFASVAAGEFVVEKFILYDLKSKKRFAFNPNMKFLIDP